MVKVGATPLKVPRSTVTQSATTRVPPLKVPLLPCTRPTVSTSPSALLSCTRGSVLYWWECLVVVGVSCTLGQVLYSVSSSVGQVQVGLLSCSRRQVVSFNSINPNANLDRGLETEDAGVGEQRG